MRVDLQSANSVSQKNAATRLPSNMSFSEVLASGRTVGGIRRERALGFAETGLLGAARIFRNTTINSASRALNLSPQIMPSSDEPRVTRPLQHSLGVSSKSQAILDLRPSAQFPNILGTSTFRFQNLSIGMADPSSVRIFPSLQTHINLPKGKAVYPAVFNRLRCDFRRRQLMVVGEDDGIVIYIGFDQIGETSKMDLMSRFQPICLKFSVTLKTIQLFNIVCKQTHRHDGVMPCR
jgi:hypothetical protein